ncbi:MAG: pilus assembly protein PilM [Phycisphaerales bacterium]|jgi:type IV pilus assembly protein PilM|nr:pilus assembly protein PilM [Phycisphaerales bacterium]
MDLSKFKKLGSLQSRTIFGSASPAIGLDFGVTGLKILQISEGSPPALVAAAIVPTPEHLLHDHAKRFAFQLDALPRAIKAGGFKGTRVACVVPAAETFCKLLQVPKNNGIPLDEQVAMTASAALECPPDAIICRSVELPSSNATRTDVLCTAVPRAIVDRLLGACRAAKLELVGIHDEFTTLLRAFAAASPTVDDSGVTTAYLDIGAAATELVIAHGKQLAFARTIPAGGLLFDEFAGESLGYDHVAAHNARLEVDAADASGGAIVTELRSPDLSEAIAMLCEEVRLCLRYHETLFPSRSVDRVVLTGGESRCRALCVRIARQLRLPAQLGDALALVSRTGTEPSMGVDLSKPQPGWSVALGVCLSPTDL